jgi:UDP-N-acetylglucosamine 2-epimerase (non-hydrolysing)
VLMRRCELIVTDSGGIQEEATAPPIRKPVLVIRLSTERPEAVEAGFAKVVGTDKKKILSGIDEALAMRRELPAVSPFGDGDAAEKIVEIILKELFT